MIIKKKFTNVRRFSEPVNDVVSEDFEAIGLDTTITEEVSEKSTSSSGEEIQSKENTSEQNDISLETPEEQEKQDVILEEEKEEPKKSVSDFDLTLDDVKFEQREERREGSRRRGYRRTQDRNIVSRAQKEALSIKEQAKQDGYKEGIELAKNDLEELRGKFSEFYAYKDVVYENVSGCILDIAVKIAKKIINKEVEVDKEYFLPVIKAAVEDVNRTENKITLKVMPKDVELVKDKIPEIFSDGTFEAKISVIPDSTIKVGGVIIETSNGLIDASLETQLGIIEKALNVKNDSES